MNFLKRIFKIGQAEANAAIDNMEDPIKLTEQGIRDLKLDLNKNLDSLAQVKALAIRAKNDKKEMDSSAEEYYNKAVIIIKKGKSGELASEEADRLAKQALLKKEEASKKAIQYANEASKLQESVNQLDVNIQELKSTINNWENELKTLKARVKVSNAKNSLNKQMAQLDSTGTVSMLERMKEKVNQEEALAEAYGEIANKNQSIDSELDKAANISEANADNELNELKKNLGLNDKNT